MVNISITHHDKNACEQTVDGINVRGHARRQHGAEEAYRQRRHNDRNEDFTWPERNAVDLETMARDAFGRMDDIHNNVVNEEGQAALNFDEVDNDEQWNEESFDFLVHESTQTVFEGSTQNWLQCGIVFYSLCSLYSVPHTFMDAMLTWIAGDLLPTSNCFPQTSYEVKTMLMKLGLKHRQVHCCPEGHVLYFDFIKHLQRMFKCPEVAKFMTWYDTHRSRGQIMRSAVDSRHWKNIDPVHPKFAVMKTNLRLGLVGDGIMSFKNNAIQHSTWVFLITMYNLPPWLPTKKFFISLAMVVSGPKAVMDENINVFLRPVVHNLLKLWAGVPTVNISEQQRQRHFILRAMLIWTVNDFPAYGLFSGQQVVPSVAWRHVQSIPQF